MTIIIIGAGAAGCETATQLAKSGHTIELIEKENIIGGNLNNWFQLFPDRKSANDILTYLAYNTNQPNIHLHLNNEVLDIQKKNGQFQLLLSNRSQIEGDALVIATGFKTFNANRKEEYGHGIYENVITSVELENMFSNHAVKMHNGDEPKRIGIIHCVGSRDEKMHNFHCSKVCCITAVKQAIELREQLPTAEIICFYMDMRMFGCGYEELYREAQEKYGIKFVRGRLSEACELMDKRLQIKTEDTLAGRPIRMSVDMLVLMVGMEASEGSSHTAEMMKLPLAPNGFLATQDPHIGVNLTEQEGVFVVGTCTGPASLTDTLANAHTAADAVNEWFKSRES